MNALLYLASFFLLTSLGVFGIDLPGAFLVEREVPDQGPSSGYFVSVPQSLPPELALPMTERVAEAIDPSHNEMKEPIALPSETVPMRDPVSPSLSTKSTYVQHSSDTPSQPTTAIAAVGDSFTTNAIVQATNNERVRAGLSPLQIDAGLTRMAQTKVDDMLRYDYFEHISPSGVGLHDLATVVGYQYILIGENLAYGNFVNPQSIVDAWMESPGHRANILHATYTHIGVSIRHAHFRGIDAWIAVQEFSIPAAACPPPSDALSAEIAAQRTQLDGYQRELTTRDTELSKTPTSYAQYNTLVAEYNALVETFRALAKTHNADVAEYNEAVRAHRACVASVSGR